MRTRVLVIAHDGVTCESLAATLTSVGFTTVKAPDGRAGRAVIETLGPPALVILDLMLPYMDGWQFLRSWRREPVGCATPILVIAEAGLLGVEDAPALGADGILYKPIDSRAVRTEARRLARNVPTAEPRRITTQLPPPDVSTNVSRRLLFPVVDCKDPVELQSLEDLAKIGIE